jgi:F0F1-type ATP synthase assembly protein I
LGKLNKYKKLKEEQRRYNKVSREMGPYLTLGWQMVLTIGLMALLGNWLDGKFDTKPWLLVVFSFLGSIIGMFSFIKTVLDLEKKRKKK